MFPNPSDACDFVSDLDSDFLDLSSDEEMDDVGSTYHAASTTYDLLDEDNAHSAQFDLTYGMDTETTASDTSPPSLSRTASSSLSSLTRSTSFTSNFSTGSSLDVHQYPTSLGHSNADSDSDNLGSSPEDFLSFSTSRSNAITDPFWSSHSRFDDTDLEIHSHASQFPDISYLKDPKEIVYKPGTSADTIRPSMNFKADPGSDSGPQMDDDQVVDGVGWEQGHEGDRRGFSSGQGSDGTGGRAYGSQGGDGHFSNIGRGRFGGRGDDDDDDDDRQRNKMSTFSTPTDSELSDETEDESTDYGVTESSPPEAASPSSSDDDVPLAQRIPTALQAQRTIRRQVREEREKHRKERALRAEQVRRRQPTLLPAGAGELLSQSVVSSSQEAAFHASLSLRRPRTNTLPSNATRPFSPEDLSRRLQTMEVVEAPVTRLYRSPSISIKPKDVIETPGGAVRSLMGTEHVSNQATEVLPASMNSHHRSASAAVKSKDMAVVRPRSSHRNLRDAGPVLPPTFEASLASTTHHHRSPSTSVKPKDATMERPGSAGRNLRDVQNVAPSLMNPLPEGHRALRPARSFHRPERRKLDDHLTEPMPSMPIDVEHKSSRSLTRTRPRGESISSHPYPYNASSRPPLVHTPMEDKLPRRSGEDSRKVIKASAEPRSARPSVDLERPSRPTTQRPPVPPLPAAEATISGPVSRGLVTQQRIFIGDMQRFNMVEIGPLTNGGDVIEMVEAQGSLKEWVGSGDWMVWEIAQDFGMGEYQSFSSSFVQFFFV